MLVDTHCHINSLSLPRRDEFLEHRGEDSLFIDVSIDIPSSERSLALSAEFPRVYSCLGFHPYSLDQYYEGIEEVYERYAVESDKVAGIGEVGLDCKAAPSLEEQAAVLERFVMLAGRLDLPLVLHNRLDGEMMFDVLDKCRDSYCRVVFHCFSQDEAFLKKVLAKDGFVSFSLNILRNNPVILSSLKAVPAEKMILETDSPYMRIQGKESLPNDISRVYERAAGLKGMEREALEAQVRDNVREIFGI